MGYFCVFFVALCDGFFVIIVRCYCYDGEFLFVYTRTGNIVVYRLYRYERINEIKALRFYFDP